MHTRCRQLNRMKPHPKGWPKVTYPSEYQSREQWYRMILPSHSLSLLPSKHLLMVQNKMHRRGMWVSPHRQKIKISRRNV